MPFFQGASHVNASHGVFNDVAGNKYNRWIKNGSYNGNINLENHTIHDSFDSMGKNLTVDETPLGYIVDPSQFTSEPTREDVSQLHWQINELPPGVPSPEIPVTDLPLSPLMHSIIAPDTQYLQSYIAHTSLSPSPQDSPESIPGGNPRHVPSSPHAPPVQTKLNCGPGAPRHSETDADTDMAIITGPIVMTVIPPTRENSLADSESELLDLTGRITWQRYPSAHGGFADVWAGYWHTESGNRKVAIKALRPQVENEEGKKRLNKKLRRELRVWQRLHHENIIPLFGVISNLGPYTSMVSPWMENGTLNNYLENMGEALQLAHRFRILREVAAGLAYLHLFDIIHGDLTGSNVLISDNGQAMLSDFGLSTIIAEFQGTSYFTSSIRGAIRWAAREMYDINEEEPVLAVSTHSDVYSFGSVMLQTLSNKIPYHYLPNDAVVLLQLDKGVYPRRPSEAWVTDDLWSFINQCWVRHPPDRPTIQNVQAFLDSCCHVLN